MMHKQLHVNDSAGAASYWMVIFLTLAPCDDILVRQNLCST